MRNKLFILHGLTGNILYSILLVQRDSVDGDSGKITKLKRLMPKSYDRNKQQNDLLHSKIDQFNPKTVQCQHFFKLKMF